MTRMLQNVSFQRLRSRRLVTALLLLFASAICSDLDNSSVVLAVQQPRSAKSGRATQDATGRFQVGVNAYQPERYAEAQRELLPLPAANPNSFDIIDLTE